MTTPVLQEFWGDAPSAPLRARHGQHGAADEHVLIPAWAADGESSLPVFSTSLTLNQLWPNMIGYSTRYLTNSPKSPNARTDIVGIFADRTAIIRLVGTVSTEQHDEWIEGGHYLGLALLTRSRAALARTKKSTAHDTTTTPALTAYTAREGSRCRANSLHHGHGFGPYER
jgi:hypothetical protein